MATAYDTWLEGDCGVDDAAEVRAERATALAEQYRDDPEKCNEAEQWVADDFDSEHYAAVTVALHQLHHTDPSHLLGTELLTTLYRLAKVVAEPMDAKLYEMAEQAVVDAEDQAEEDASEARAAAREAA